MKRVFAVFVLLFLNNLFAQETLDKIVAVVDNEIILKSEFDFQVGLLAAQQRINPSAPGVKEQILNSMIEEKLLYARAKLDSIEVSDEDVNRQVDYRIDLFTQQYGSREKVEQIYGMSIEKIKRELRDDVRKYLMAETVKQKKFGVVDITRREVEDFFNTYRDSLGLVPEKLKLAHIFINPAAGEKVKNEARKLAEALLDSVRNGANFEALAKKYSDDPGSAVQGGDLGFTKRGALVPEFEAAAFALKEGEVSGVIETQFGFHIIQTVEKRGESIHTRHILIKIKSDEDADIKAIQLLNDLKDSIRTGKNTFEYYAKKYSDDKETAKLGGSLGNLDIGQVDKAILDVVSKMKTGEISFPKRIDMGQGVYGYHILYVADRVPEHKPTMEKDYAEIKKAAEFNKQQKLYLAWMKELKESIFWEIRL